MNHFKKSQNDVILTFVLVTFIFGQGEPQKTGNNLTGEIKPVIYVTDVEKSAPFYRDILRWTPLSGQNFTEISCSANPAI